MAHRNEQKELILIWIIYGANQQEEKCHRKSLGIFLPKIKKTT